MGKGVRGELVDVLSGVAGLAHGGDRGEHESESVALAGYGDSCVGGYPDVGLRGSLAPVPCPIVSAGARRRRLEVVDGRGVEDQVLQELAGLGACLDGHLGERLMHVDIDGDLALAGQRLTGQAEHQECGNQGVRRRPASWAT